MSTVFTKIIQGEIPGRFVWSDDVCVAFATINPISPGHMLVVPRAEVAKYSDADDDLLAHLARVTKYLSKAIERAFDAPRAAIIVAGFEVPHLHLHVIPAWGEAELSFENAQTDVEGEELDDACARVRQALVELGLGEGVPPRIDTPTR